MNYIRCDDLPIVFTKVLTLDDTAVLSYNYGDDKLAYPFTPDRVCMQPSSGRVYHPAPDRVGGVGLVKSQIALDWSRYFHYEKGAQEDRDPPTHFTWQGHKYELSNDMFDTINTLSALARSDEPDPLS